MSSTNLLYRHDASCVLSREPNFRQVAKMNMNFISYSSTTVYAYTDFHELLLIFICAIKTKIKSVSSDVQRTVTWELVSLALMGDAGTAWEENVQLLTS